MGYRGKVVEQERARQLRTEGWTLRDIATELGVSRSSVSLWVRDLPVVPVSRSPYLGPRTPHPARLRKLEEIERCREEAVGEIGDLSRRDLMLFALALYAGEGAKGDGQVKFANTDSSLIRLFLAWLRSGFQIDESRLRCALYLHADLDLDLDEAQRFWSRVTSIPVDQCSKPYRAVVDPTMRNNRHRYGCATVKYSCSSTHRRVMALIEAVSSSVALPG
jgi:transcriptional regulator with XRE-family HTH domain